jgi:uncharacterized membrane protein
MGALVFIIAFALTPLIFSIVALVRANNARSTARRLQQEVELLRRGAPPASESPARPPTPESPPPEAAPPGAPPAAKPRVALPPLPAFKLQQEKTASGGPNLEVALGGKVAAFIGIAALVLSVAFFVGYAIRHGWIGPGMRIVLGLFAGGVLIALGHLAETRGKNLHVLARVLTGGGAALLFFSVFAAHGFYGLISPIAAAAGLIVTALAVMGLSVVYHSQIVALLGVLGAFITPLAVGGDLDRGLFPLAYLAAVNATVMVLGVRRNWQSLYNVSFVFTFLYTAAWLGRELHRNDGASWALGLVFSVLYFAEYITLGLVKLKGERGSHDQAVDLLRMLSSSLLLLGAVYWILDTAALNAWIGGAFLLLAVAHIAVARLAWRWLPRFKNDILVLLAGALTFATLALPVQLDGVWVSLGWAFEGLVLSWFALRFGVGVFRSAGMFLGMLGLGKAVLFDVDSMDSATKLFLNSRFAVSLIATVLLGVQSRLYRRMRESEDGSRPFEDALLMVASIGFVLAVATDGVLVLQENNPWAWMPSIMSLLIAAAFVLNVGARQDSSSLQVFGSILLGLLPIALVLFVFGLGWNAYDDDFAHFLNAIFLIALVLLAGSAWLTARFAAHDGSRFPREPTLNILCLLAGIFLVSLEIGRAETPWKDSAITLWWGACALALILLGLRFQKRYLRHTALALFGLTIGKVFLVDLAALSGLIRVAAFMGVGVILLVVSFTYQRIAPKLADAPLPKPVPPGSKSVES